MSSVVTHSILPGYEKARHELMPGETITHFLERASWSFRLPTICVLNGQPVLRGAWESTIILPSDDVIFLSKPWGGGGEGIGSSKNMQIFGIIAIIALAAIAPWAAGAIGAGLGFSATGIAALTAVIGIGGSLLISTFLKPDAGGTSETDSSSTAQLYSIAAGGNTAKPLQPINIQYGRLKNICAYASSPYSEYVGDDQYLCVALCIGAGKYFSEQILMDDTVIWDSTTGYNPAFSGVQVAFYNPGVPVDLFPLNIISADEVSNIQVPSWTGTEWVGGFIANDPDVDCIALSFDFALPAGLYAVIPDTNDLTTRTITIVAEARRVDVAGTPLEAYVQIFNESITLTTRQPKRYTKKVDLPPDRYEVRIRRTTVETSGETGQDTLVWVGLRVHIDGPETFEHTSTCALRIKATAQISNSSSRQFSVICTRILNVWDGVQFVESPSKSPIWAFLDMAVNSTYGADRPLNKIDFQKIITEATASSARGDEFNYNFTNVTTFQRAFDVALATTRAKHCWAGDILTLVRDEWRPIPSMLLTDQQIIRGSLEVQYIFNDEDSADAVIGEFLNDQTWKPAEVQYPPNSLDFTAINPSRVRLEGITDTDQMYREVAFLYRQSLLRRIKVNFDTEHDGRILKFGSAIKVQSYLPKRWGQSGEVTAYNSGTKIMTLDRALVFTPATQHYIELRDKRGRYFGPVMCGSVIGQPLQILINAGDLTTVEANIGMTLVNALDRMDGAEPPAFAFGIASSISRHCMVVSGRPSGDRVSLNCVVDLESVHSTSLDTLPAGPVGTDLFDPKTPVVGLLYAIFRQGVAEPILDVTWFPAAGALFYRAQVSYDGQNTWEPIYEGVEPKCSAVVLRVGALHVRVAAFNDRHGPWSVFGPIDGPTIIIGRDTVSTSSMIAGLRDYVTRELREATDKVQGIANFIANHTSEQDFANATEKSRILESLQLTVGEFAASIEEVRTIAVGTESAFASYQITVNASLGALSTSVTTQATALATLEDGFFASYSLTLDVNDFVSGFQSVNDGSFAAFTIVADVFRLAQPGVSGGSPVVPFQVGISNGVAKMVMKGDFFADGDITGRMINALSINTQHLAVNSVDINKLIAGAAAAADLYSGGLVTMTNPGVLYTGVSSGAVSFPALGKVLIQATVDFDNGASNFVGATTELSAAASSITIGIYLNGALIDSHVVPGTTLVPHTFSPLYTTQQRFTASVPAMAFTSAGNNTIEVRVSWVDGSTGTIATSPRIFSTKMIVTQLRKAA